MSRTGQQRPGFLLYLPFYKPGKPIDTLDQRLEAFAGWVYAPFVSDDFFSGILGIGPGQLTVHVYEGPKAAAGSLIFDSTSGTSTAVASTSETDLRPLSLRGHIFSVGFSRGENFPAAGNGNANTIRLFGVITSFAMALTLWSLVGSRSKARAAAERATAELRATTALQERMLRGAPYATISIKLDGTITLFNRAAEELLGYSAEELIEKENVQILLRGSAAESLGITGENKESATIQAYLQMIASNPGQEYDWKFTRKDGSKFPGRLSLAHTTDGNGKVTGMVGMVRNIEIERRAQEVESRLAAIVDSSGDAIFSVDSAGLFTSWNRGAEELLGYTQEEALGMPALLIVPEDEQAQATEIRSAMQRGETLRFETTRLKKDGSIVDVAITISPLRDEHGEVVATASLLRDISAEKRARVELQEMLEVLESNSFVLTEQAEALDGLRREAEFLANHDGLTGVYNRRAWFACGRIGRCHGGRHLRRRPLQKSKRHLWPSDGRCRAARGCESALCGHRGTWPGWAHRWRGVRRLVPRAAAGSDGRCGRVHHGRCRRTYRGRRYNA